MSDGYWNHIEQYYETVSIYDGQEVFDEAVAKIPDYAADLLATHWFLSEMSNGGIGQFFDNSTAVVAERAISGFEKMELPQVANTLRQAMKKFESAPAGWTIEIFEPEERAIYAFAGSNLGRIYDRMDEYAEKRS